MIIKKFKIIDITSGESNLGDIRIIIKILK